jgi:nitroreductase
MNASPDLNSPSVTLAEAAASRRSIRAFLCRPVPRALLEKMLSMASSAPSGSNTQPWRVYVLHDECLAQLAAALAGAFMANEPRRPDYEHYASPLPEPYLARRRACGNGLYSTLGIAKGDQEGVRAYRARNYAFFGAPAALVCTIDRALCAGSWVDYGMFLQTAMLAARSLGLHTCAEGSIAEYPDLVRAQLGLEHREIVLCGMAIGYADPDAEVNHYQPRRCELSEFVTFLDASVHAGAMPSS